VASPRESGGRDADRLIHWSFGQFAELTPQQIHDLYRLRVAVFIVEQNCVFQDVDGHDPVCWHLLGYGAGPKAGAGSALAHGELVAYCRLLPAGAKFPEPSIGRVITAPSVRGTGTGRVLMAEAMRCARALFGSRQIRIGAQAHLERFYNEFGFTKVGEPYDEDGILHIEMETANG
jgi:ElaA protein